MPWVEQRDADLTVPPGQIWEFRYIGGADTVDIFGGKTFAPTGGLGGDNAQPPDVQTFVINALKNDYESFGPSKPLSVYYDDLKQEWVATVKCVLDTTLRVLRIESPEYFLPNGTGIALRLNRMRLLVGQAEPDPVAQGFDKVQVTIASAAAAVGDAAERGVKVVTETGRDAIDSVQALLKSLPLVLVGAAAIALILLWPKVKAGVA